METFYSVYRKKGITGQLETSEIFTVSDFTLRPEFHIESVNIYGSRSKVIVNIEKKFQQGLLKKFCEINKSMLDTFLAKGLVFLFFKKLFR